MAQKYRVIKRRNLGKDADQVSHKYYAQPISNGNVGIDEICSDISEYCSLTSADVKAVLDRLNFVLDKHLRAGRNIMLGEMGNFRLSFGSSGTENPEDFHTSKIRKPKITFTPGKLLQKTREQTSYERDNVQVVKVTEPCELPHAI